jgi:hypothetical protein
MIKAEDKIEKIPFFSKGSLVFKESGHTLIKDRNQYRCSEKSKNKCHIKFEKPLNAKNLEDKFSRLVEKFYLPEGSSEKMFDHLLELYVKTLRIGGRRDMHLENLLESTGNLIIADLKEGKETPKSDFLLFKKTYFELIKNFYGDLLIGIVIDFLFVLTKNQSEQDDMTSFLRKLMGWGAKKLDHKMAFQIRHIYLSNDGHIENIEFEPFAWFILNYFMNLVREYEPDVPRGFITNTKEFESFDYFKVVEELTDNDLKDTYSYNAFATEYSKEKMIKIIFGGFENLSVQEKIDYLAKLNAPTKEMFFAHIKAVVR